MLGKQNTKHILGSASFRFMQIDAKKPSVV